jgi:hypothetical protein
MSGKPSSLDLKRLLARPRRCARLRRPGFYPPTEHLPIASRPPGWLCLPVSGSEQWSSYHSPACQGPLKVPGGAVVRDTRIVAGIGRSWGESPRHGNPADCGGGAFNRDRDDNRGIIRLQIIMAPSTPSPQLHDAAGDRHRHSYQLRLMTSRYKPIPSFRRTPEPIPTPGKAIIQMQHGLSPVERWVPASAAIAFTHLATAKPFLLAIEKYILSVIPAKAGTQP